MCGGRDLEFPNGFLKYRSLTLHVLIGGQWFTALVDSRAGCSLISSKAFDAISLSADVIGIYPTLR